MIYIENEIEKIISKFKEGLTSSRSDGPSYLLVSEVELRQALKELCEKVLYQNEQRVRLQEMEFQKKALREDFVRRNNLIGKRTQYFDKEILQEHIRKYLNS